MTHNERRLSIDKNSPSCGPMTKGNYIFDSPIIFS